MTGGVPVVMARMRSNYNIIYVQMLWSEMVTCYKLATILAQLYPRSTIFITMIISTFYIYHYLCQVLVSISEQ